MSVLFVHDHYFLRQGDALYSNTLSHTILRRYAQVFSEVTVAARCRDASGELRMPTASGEGVGFAFFENLSTLGSFFGPRRRARERMRRLVDSHDAVIVRLPSELGMLAADAARSMGKPVLVEVVGSAWGVMWHYGSWRGRVYAPYFSWKTARILRRSQWSSYVTESFLQHDYPSSKHAVTEAISDAEVAMTDTDILSRRLARIEAKEGRIVIGLIASLKVRYKGIETLLSALAELKAGAVDFECRIVGEGDASFYEKLAKGYGLENDVVFHGELGAGAAVYDWFDEVDIYVQPSLTEGLPRSLIEAMSRGCPAVGSAVGGVPELLETQMLCPPGDASALAAKIRTLAEDRTLMKAEACRNVARASAFRKSVLDAKRTAFLTAFRDASVR